MIRKASSTSPSRLSRLAVFTSIFALCASLAGAAEIRPYALSINHIEDPVGIDTQSIVFSWKIRTDQRDLRDVRQTAYRISLSERAPGETGNVLWDSGKVSSDQSVSVPYTGPELESRKTYDWQVSLWTNQAQDPASARGSFEMGLLHPADWSAQWIGAAPDGSDLSPSPAPLFRKSIQIKKPIESARAYVSGVGYFDMTLNGDPVSDHVLDPVVTRYDKRTKYVVFDLSPQLRPGENALGITLGNGWFNQHTRSVWDFEQAPWRAKPRLIAQIELRYVDGERETIVSDDGWKWKEGPVTFDGIRNGVHYDANREMPGWDTPEFDDSDWKPALVVEAPTHNLSAQLMPPARVIDQLEAREVHRIDDNIAVYDFGINTSGRIRATVSGRPGDEIVFRYGERVFPDGRLDQKELSRFIRSGETQTDRYTIGPTGQGVFEPSLMYHGFQYVEVETLSPSARVDELRANVVHTDFENAGHFESSSDLLNELYQVSRNSFLTNFHSYPTDCPHREKIGWTGDAQMVLDFGFFNFDATRAYKKWSDDILDEQRPNGQVPSIIPTSGWGYVHGNQKADESTRKAGYGPQWAGVCISMPWSLYLNTGDKTLLEKYYPMMKRYYAYLDSWSEDGTLNIGIDDHKWIRLQTHGPVIASAYFCHFADILADAATVLGIERDTGRFESQGRRLKAAFNRRFFDPETGQYDVGSQTSQALALAFDLVPDQSREKAIRKLVETIEKEDGHPVAGVVGVRAMTDTLPEIGRSDLLFEMVTKRSMPSWGWWLGQGATTLWQNWDGSQSRNHIMFGSVNDFLYENLAGIQIDPQQPAYKHFFVRPYIPQELSHASAWHESPHGKVRSAWYKNGDTLRLTVEAPPNTQATIEIPVSPDQSISESAGNEKGSPDGVRIVRKNGYAVIKIGSGKYQFEIKPASVSANAVTNR